MLPSLRKWALVYILGTFVLLVVMIENLGKWCPEECELERKKLQMMEHKFQQQVQHTDLLKRKLTDLQIDMKHRSSNRKRETFDKSGLPIIYVITPTYKRLEQKAELTRLSYTFRLVPNLHWIVVEDSDHKTTLVSKFLEKSKLTYTHLNAVTPQYYKLKETDPNWLKPRGVDQRNAGIQWLHRNANFKGVVYFADDDNTYDLDVFEEMRYTKKASVWPVGLVGYLLYESPIVSQGKVTGWHTYWKPQRMFATDMAGFAVNVQLFIDHPNALFDIRAGRGNLESSLLTQLGVTLQDLEPKADNCSKILVWHTRTEKSSLKNEEKMMAKYGRNSDKTREV